MQGARASVIDYGLRMALTDAINKRCKCGYQMEAIDSGDFSCETTTNHATYRSTIHGTSDKHTATELLAFIQDWVMTEGTFTAQMVRMRARITCTSIFLKSFHDYECSDDALSDPDPETGMSHMSKCFGSCLQNEYSSVSSAAGEIKTS